MKTTYKAHSIAVKIALIDQEKKRILSHLKMQKLILKIKNLKFIF